MWTLRDRRREEGAPEVQEVGGAMPDAFVSLRVRVCSGSIEVEDVGLVDPRTPREREGVRGLSQEIVLCLRNEAGPRRPHVGWEPGEERE